MDFERLSRFERINVVGTAGSGKSTFARELAEVLNFPCYEMDQLFWKPNWQESPEDEFSQMVRDVTSQPRWVLDGNYTRTLAEKWRQVQLVIWLDLSFTRTVYRVTKRVLRRSLSRQEIWPGTGNRESLTKAFVSKDSIIWWAITTYRSNRNKYAELMVSTAYSQITFIRLRSPACVASFLTELRNAVEKTATG